LHLKALWFPFCTVLYRGQALFSGFLPFLQAFCTGWYSFFGCFNKFCHSQKSLFLVCHGAFFRVFALFAFFSVPFCTVCTGLKVGAKTMPVMSGY